MTTLRALVVAVLVAGTFSLAVAKLPPPPPLDDNAKAAAEEKKAKDAAAAAADAAALARAQDRVAARYLADQRSKGRVVTPQMGRTAQLAPAAPAKGAKAAKK